MKKNIIVLMCVYIVSSCYSTDVDFPDLHPVTVPEEDPFSPERVLLAYKKAYPDKITEISFKNNDWALKVYDRWYYWADGRILPEEEILSKDDYSAHLFYPYPEVLPTFQIPDEELTFRIEEILQEKSVNPISRHPDFLGSLWRIWDRDTSWNRVKTTYFLGYKLQIHRDLLEDLARVEEEIQRRMLVDRELAEFVRSLMRIDGYNWREIADTETLSVHSYGTAVDLILNRTGGKQIYWLWTHNSGETFYKIPYEKRFSPPLAFIEAFEREGFVWGGKWLFYDTIHFEYRPEILILNKLRD